MRGEVLVDVGWVFQASPNFARLHMKAHACFRSSLEPAISTRKATFRRKASILSSVVIDGDRTR